jgi:hypothetical protein
MRRGQTLLEYLATLKGRELVASEFDGLVDYACRINYASHARDATLEKVFRNQIRSRKSRGRDSRPIRSAL